MRTQTTSKMKQRFISVIAVGLIALMMPTAVFAQEGTLKSGKITSPALENLIGDSTTKPYRIYLPPSYETSDERYPTVYILPGYSQTIGSFMGTFPIKSTADSMIRNGDIKEMIVVFVEGYNKFGGAYFLNSETIGDYENYITRDLVNHIDANYRTIAHRNSRGITGYSMGGDSAMHLAMKFPETFSVVVPNAAGYDRISDWWSGFARQTAFVNPKNWGEFSQIPFGAQAGFAYAAAACPNPDKPPFFLDKPYELVDGKAQVVPEVWECHAKADVIHEDLPRYLEQPVRLNGIMIVHGIADSVSLARTFDKALTDAGIEHVYDEHGGGHIFVADKSLQFLSDHLSDQLPTVLSAVDVEDKLATTWAAVKQR